MALGYCDVCDRLVSIRPGPQKWGSRERQWFPIPHDNQEGKLCPGDKKAL